MSQRLSILFVSPFLPAPATFGAQRRIQGLLAALAKTHDVTAMCVAPPSVTTAAAMQGVEELGANAVIIRGRSAAGASKRVIQMRSLLSAKSYERHLLTLPEMQRALDELLSARSFDLVNVEFPFLSHYRLRQCPPGARAPRLVLDEHNIEYDLVRQMTGLRRGIARHVHNAVNWRKLRREEIDAWREFDGVTFTSNADIERARSDVSGLRARVVANGVDVDSFRGTPDVAGANRDTVIFFGTFNYFPNYDGVLFFLREIWPVLARSHPNARLKFIGADPPSDVLAFSGPRVEFTGLVDDIRPHIASAAVSVVPLRIGGGTRLKILEAMAMGKAIVTTTLGVEGIDATPGRDLLVEDNPAGFAAAIGQILDDPMLARELGHSARLLAERSYSWDAAARNLESFFEEVLAAPVKQ